MVGLRIFVSELLCSPRRPEAQSMLPKLAIFSTPLYVHDIVTNAINKCVAHQMKSRE